MSVCSLAATLCVAQSGKNAPASARTGYVQLADNTYHNDYLGFRFKLPAGWVVSTDVAGTLNGLPTQTQLSAGGTNAANLAEAANSPQSAVYLMRATPSGQGEAPATLYVMAEDLAHQPEIKSPLAYLVRLNNALSQQQMKFMGVTGGIVRGTKKTYRALYSRTGDSAAAGTNSGGLYYSMDVVLLHNHAVVFVLAAKDANTLEEMKSLLEGVDFTQPTAPAAAGEPSPPEPKPVEEVKTPPAKPPVVDPASSAPVKTVIPEEKKPAPVVIAPPVSATTVAAEEKKPEQKSAESTAIPPAPAATVPTTTDTPTPAPTVPAGEAAPARIFLPEKAMEGYVLSKVPPQYPEYIVGRERVTAVVVLKVVISREGRIKSQSLLSGNSDFVIEAMEAIREWRYKPFLVKGVPVEVETQLTVTFKP